MIIKKEKVLHYTISLEEKELEIKNNFHRVHNTYEVEVYKWDDTNQIDIRISHCGADVPNNDLYYTMKKEVLKKVQEEEKWLLT